MTNKQIEEKATFKFSVRAPSGYECEGEDYITLEQWGHINRVLAGEPLPDTRPTPQADVKHQLGYSKDEVKPCDCKNAVHECTDAPNCKVTLRIKQHAQSADGVKRLEEVTRVEVIDINGRAYSNWNPGNKVELSFQDSGKTLKVFITNVALSHKEKAE